MYVPPQIIMSNLKLEGVMSKATKDYSEIKLPQGLLGHEKIVGVTNFRGDVVIATEHHVYRMSNDHFGEIMFESVGRRDDALYQ